VPRYQLAILERLNVPVQVAHEGVSLPAADLIIDAFIGYSLHGAPRGSAAALIRSTNAHRAPTLALDVPSGVDASEGSVHDPAVQAAATMTLALPKQGLAATGVRENVGEMYLPDIGVPPELYAKPPLDLEVGAIFAEGDVLRVW
jgi:NAD(P)H-hydrate epimerase